MGEIVFYFFFILIVFYFFFILIVFLIGIMIGSFLAEERLKEVQSK